VNLCQRPLTTYPCRKRPNGSFRPIADIDSLGPVRPFPDLRSGTCSRFPLGHLFAFDLIGFLVEIVREGAEFPLGLYVFGAVGNIATLVGATAECFRV